MAFNLAFKGLIGYMNKIRKTRIFGWGLAHRHSENSPFLQPKTAGYSWV